MRIAIDARMYGTAQRGIGRYLMKLIENLEAISPLRGGSPPLSGDTYTIFLRSQNFEEYQPRNPNFQKALWDAEWYGVREQLHFRALTKPPLNLPLEKGEKEGVDLFHFPHWNVPVFFRRPFVVTIHDLQLFSLSRVRESTTRGRLAYFIKYICFKIIFRHAVLASRAIIVPSNYVKELLATKYPQTRGKIRVIYEAPTIVKSQIPNPKSQTNSNPQILNSKFVLYVGAAYPHKNLERLFEAWSIAREKLQGYKLVLVGKEDFFWKRIKQQHVTMLSCYHVNIVWYGEATDKELSLLYQRARLLVQPSIEEGFSLTPLEALSFGCPVAVSDIPAHQEILQDAALYFDPRSPQKIADAILCLLANEKLRQDTIKRGVDILKNYSWRAHANDTLLLYNDVIG